MLIKIKKECPNVDEQKRRKKKKNPHSQKLPSLYPKLLELWLVPLN
jgi:hypothetical protein